MTNLTCSEINWVSPTTPLSSFQTPRNNSPKKGFKGFFSEPLYLSISFVILLTAMKHWARASGEVYSFSFLELYCCFSVDRNHLSTASALFSGFSSCAGATKISGCSPCISSQHTATPATCNSGRRKPTQYPEYSVKLVTLNMNGCECKKKSAFA